MKKLRLSDAPEGQSGEECEPAGVPRSERLQARLTCRASSTSSLSADCGGHARRNAIPVSGMGGGLFRPFASRSMRFADVFNGATWEISVYLDLDTGEVN